jgi:regulator of protease activity HflC (stomatin/prohibitin superfamily)
MINILLALAVLVAVSVAWFRLRFKPITVFEYERGLKYRKGRFETVLQPGRYWVYLMHTSLVKLDIRPRFVTVPGQELVSSDGVSVKVSLAARYEVTDPYAAVLKNENYETALYLLLQVKLREIVGAAKIDEVLEKRNLLGQMLMESSEKPAEELGLKLHSVNLKDIMFPGELKKVFAQAVKAQKEGLAALEKARGETAALRSLANAARMIQDNPALLQIRLLQHLGETPGNTLVLGVPTAAPLPIRSPQPSKPEAGQLGAPEEKGE